MGELDDQGRRAIGIFLRAYRTTLPSFGYSKPLDTADMTIERRISATYKDL
ncbi:carbon-phosphorus lyase complex subunit PhnI, partial [Rhizobium ruizarguesonis]